MERSYKVILPVATADEYYEIMAWLKPLYFSSESRAADAKGTLLIMEYTFFFEEDALAFVLRFGGKIANMGNH